MKKTYEKPRMEVAEFRFAEHIAASGDSHSSGSCSYSWYKVNDVYTSSCITWTSPSSPF